MLDASSDLATRFFGAATGVAVDGDGNVYVADWSGNEITKFTGAERAA